jgi:predicted permease
MAIWTRLRSWLRSILHPSRTEREIDSELRFHVESYANDLIRQGVAAQEAKRRALIEFGGIEQTKELCRETGRTKFFEELGQDLRFGWHGFKKNPGFTTVAIVTLALGIGATTAIFSVVDTVLLRSLPYHQPDRLVYIYEDGRKAGFPRQDFTPADYLDCKAQGHVFEEVAVVDGNSFILTGPGIEPEKLWGYMQSSNLFPMLGASPLIGRIFSAEEDRPGYEHVVLLSYRLWKRQFAGDVSVLNRQILLNDQKYTVIGVMPPEFSFPDKDVDLWVPKAFRPDQLESRGEHYLSVYARLREGVNVKEANADLSVLFERLRQQHLDVMRSIDGFVVETLQQTYTRDVRLGLTVLLAAVGFILLIACANVANLLLSRAALRQREVALRSILGASRGRIVRQLLTENILLAGPGGVIGILLAAASFNFLKVLIPSDLSRTISLKLNLTVLGTTLAVSLFSVILFGLAPALRISRNKNNFSDALKDGAKGATGARLKNLGNALVVSQIALCLVLLVGSGLLLQSLVNLRRVNPGFRSDHVLAVGVPNLRSVRPDFARQCQFFESVLQRVRAVPGVKSAGFTSVLPILWKETNGMYSFVPDGVAAPDITYGALDRVVSPGYFEAMQIPLLRGRFFDDRDRQDAPLVAIVNDVMARKFWPNEASVVGKRLGVPAPAGPIWIQIVGVVGNVKQLGLDVPPREEMYFPYWQGDGNPMIPNALVIRTAGDPEALAGTIRQIVWSVNPNQPVAYTRTMDDILDDESLLKRVQTILLGGLAALALILACVGIYGLVAYFVTQQSREIGIRMALGAQSRNIQGIVLGRGARLAVFGVGIGLLVALVVRRLMDSLLFDVAPFDPLSFAAGALLLSAVALAASYIPARRATRVDPMVVLRYE